MVTLELHQHYVDVGYLALGYEYFKRLQEQEVEEIDRLADQAIAQKR